MRPILLLLSACLFTSSAMAQSVGFKIYRSDPMTPGDSAGAVPAVNWNNLRDIRSGVPLTLPAGTIKNSAGQIVPALTATINPGATVAGSNTLDQLTGSPNDARLFNAAYVQGSATAGAPTTVNVANIPFANYDVYVYMADMGGGSAAKVDYGDISYVASGGLPPPAGGASRYVLSTALASTSPNTSKGNTLRIPNLHGPLNLRIQAVSNGDSTPVMGLAGIQIVATAAPSFVQTPTPVYQWAAPLVPVASEYTVPLKPDPDAFAYLWLPPGLSQVRGLLVGVQNMLERDMFSDPTIRQALAEAGMGIVWISESASMDLGRDPWNGPRPTSGDNAAQAALELARVLNALAVQSGYSEIANAPLIMTGHSAASAFVWTAGVFAKPALAGRVMGLLPYKGTYPGYCPPGIPMMNVQSEWAEINQLDATWNAAAGFIQGLLGQRKECLLGADEDVGSGHYDWNPSAAGPIAQFIKSVAATRLPATLPSSGTVSLLPVGFNSGYVIPYAQLGQANTVPIAATTYSGGTGTAYWYPDAATAQAVNARMASELAKQPQLIDVPVRGTSQLATAGLPQFGTLNAQPDGTFKVAGQFISTSPSATLYTNQTLGHSTTGGIQYRPNGSAGTRQVGPDTFRIWIDRGNVAFQGYPSGGVVLASHPGDSAFRSADRPFNVHVVTVNTGNSQTLSVSPILKQQALNLQPIQLQGTASSGMPVQFWVVAGPYTITTDGVLKPEPLPVRASYPMQVTVGAYQIGGLDANNMPWQSVGPVYTTFTIELPNLAQGKAATQSSTFAGTTPASRAVDGNTDGNAFAGSITHTNNAPQEWWQVDLGQQSAVQTVRLWNRTECCSERLSNFYVLVSATDMTGRTLAQLQADGAVTKMQVASLNGNPSIALPLAAGGRYVRVQLSGTDYLSLAEVQVFGTPLSNLALGKAATQSSTFVGTTPASRAVDGNTDGNAFAGSITHTNNAPQEWWQVDLGQQSAVQTVRLWNRTECCSERLSNFYVLVSATDMTGRTLAQLLADGTVTKAQVNSLNGNPSITLPLAAAGRYVRVQLAGTDFLSLAEVQVFGAGLTQ